MNDICQLLKETRIGKGLSLDEVAQRTYIKLHYLEALEEGQLDRLPAMVHTYGYIRQYAKLLGLDGGALVAQFQQYERGGKPARTPTAELLGESLSFLKPIKATYGNGNGQHANGNANGNGHAAPTALADQPPPTPPTPPASGPSAGLPPSSAPELPSVGLPAASPFASGAPVAPPPSSSPPGGGMPFFRPGAEPQELQEARAQAQQVLLAAEREARTLVRGAETYADEVLGKLEAEVASVLNVIQNGRRFLASRRRTGPQGLG